ncbi:MAG: hypothetical protein WAO08_26400 [Hyphomicrobiaceae bacterium]
MRNPLQANQKGGYTLFIKAVADAIIELARDSCYVEICARRFDFARDGTWR